MLPEDTTRTGYSVLRAKRTPPHTARAPSITIPTRRSPRAVSFLLINFQNLRTKVLKVSNLVGVLLLEGSYLGLVLNPPQKLFCSPGTCGQELLASRGDPVNLSASAAFGLP